MFMGSFKKLFILFCCENWFKLTISIFWPPPLKTGIGICDFPHEFLFPFITVDFIDAINEVFNIDKSFDGLKILHNFVDLACMVLWDQFLFLHLAITILFDCCLLLIGCQIFGLNVLNVVILPTVFFVFYQLLYRFVEFSIPHINLYRIFR